MVSGFNEAGKLNIGNWRARLHRIEALPAKVEGRPMALTLRMGQFEVDANDLLGQGGFGRVYRGWDTTTGTILAVKELDPRQVSRDKILLEVQIMELVTGHPSFIAILGAQELQSGEIYIFMELAAGELRGIVFVLTLGSLVVSILPHR